MVYLKFKNYSWIQKLKFSKQGHCRQTATICFIFYLDGVLLLTVAIDAHEGRFIATCDITIAFFKADMDEFVLLILQGKEIEALIQANPKYEKYIHTRQDGKKVLYLELNKTMYGCLKSTCLFWEHLSSFLGKIGFTQNKYDLCVGN